MKKQQILFIDGGETAENFSSYIEEFKKLEVKNPFEENKRWKYTLQGLLGDNYKVAIAETPNDFFAKYEEWKIMFEKIIPYLEEGIILMGHSLGGSFLVKYLNENDFPVEIKKILLISPCFEDNEVELLGSFNFDKKLKTFKKYSDKTIMYYSLDDFLVPVSDFGKFKEVLPDMEYREFRDRGHFLQEEFPEVIEDIKNLQ